VTFRLGWGSDVVQATSHANISVLWKPAFRHADLRKAAYRASKLFNDSPQRTPLQAFNIALGLCEVKKCHG